MVRSPTEETSMTPWGSELTSRINNNDAALLSCPSLQLKCQPSQWLIALFSVRRICRFSLTLIDTLDTLVVRTHSALKVVLVCMMLGSNSDVCV